MDYFLDIRRDTCPLTFVKTKLLLEKMHSGQIAELLLSEGEALQSLPIAIQELGCHLLKLEKHNETPHYTLTVQKG